MRPTASPGLRSRLAGPLAQAAVSALLVFALLAAFLLFSYRSTEATITTASRNEVRVLATQLGGALRRIEMSVDFVHDKYGRLGLHENTGSPAWKDSLARLQLDMAQLGHHFPEVRSMLIADREGQVQASNLSETPQWNISDRAYFQQAREQAADRLQFSEPLLDKGDARPIVIAYRSILDPGGRFAGLVAVALDLQRLQALLAGVDTGDRGMVSVSRSDDSRLILRWPAAAAKLNQTAPEAPSFQRIQAGETSGVARYVGVVDGVERIFAFHRLERYPFFVLIGRAVDEQFALWWRTGSLASLIAVATLALLLAMQASLHRSRRQLARNKRDFDALVESRQEATCAWLPDTTLLTCNERYAELLGKAAASLPGTRWIDGLPPHLREQTASAIAQMLQGAGPLTTDRRIRQADGSSRWLRWLDLPVLDDEGRCIEVRSIGQDITAQKETELRLRQLALAVEQSPNTIVITDTEGRIEYVNEAFVRTTGYAVDEAIGRNPRLLNAGKTPPATYADLWDTLGRGEVWRGEFINTRKDGAIYTELATIAPIKQADGSISHYVAIKEDITERREAEARIRQLAYFDTLTGLPNRSLMWDRLRQAIAASERSGSSGMLLLLDIDHFKLLNDTQGHQAGDALLQEVARRLRAALREEDTVARLGDDDFAIVIEGLGEDRDEAIAHAEKIAGHLHRCVTAPCELGLASGAYHVGASLGLTLFRGRAATADAVLKQAEVAVARAKDDGRNLIRFFSEAMQAVVAARAELELKLRAALAGNGFRLYYQPQLDRNARVIGAEALIRCFDANGTMISPAAFIPLAEETGLIVPIGEWVLEAACAQLRAWQRETATAALTLSINVSARQFHQPDFVGKVAAAIERSRIHPGGLKIELTESVVIGDIETTVLRMRQIKALGVKFALDDFGTGYSSLSYLKRLPFDQLKIDQMFVRDMEKDTSSEAIVRAILAISRSLDLEVVAEGVETTAQHELLLTRGCELFQGYLFGRPVPIEAWKAD
ncbi:EAL domain-containing protein [Thauera sp.]|uniref:bifunctional diguanylate cyclase/phosphodiesterase n=1 Tax=Thauera sp. TaxID=1905334 RepID=UPI002C570DD3|nr:EAL domain-containing protein [Thauera sp.]HRO37630.1 EAL domain-containing protein [Thauera sp.]